MKIRVLFFLSLLACSVISEAKSDSSLVGLWEQTIIADDNEYDDRDLFYISNFKNKILINSVDYDDFAIGQIKKDGKKLTFTMVNLVDPDEIYILKYTCITTTNRKKIKCSFINQKGEEEPNIIWTIKE